MTECVLCPGCKVWNGEAGEEDVGQGCMLCNDSLIVPATLAVEYALLGLGEKFKDSSACSFAEATEFEIQWAEQVTELRLRYGLKVDR